MKKVPRQPEQASLRTGDRVRIAVIADQKGYATVFNVGPSGNLNLLYPDEPTSTPSPVDVNTPLHVVDVEMTPPSGRERLFAVWTRQPLPLRLDQLVCVAQQTEDAASKPYAATRDMKRVKDSLDRLVEKDWHAALLELAHASL
jgi:hypothetical protein